MHKFLPLLLAAAISGCAGNDSLVRQARCSRPSLGPPGQPISQSDATRINDEGKSYRHCLKSYIAERKLVVEKHSAIANVHVAAANSAQAEFNEYVAELNARAADLSPKE